VSGLLPPSWPRAGMLRRYPSDLDASAGCRQLAIVGAQHSLGEMDMNGAPERFTAAAETWHAMLAGLFHAIAEDQGNL